MKKCERCGFPVKLVRFADWRTDGTIFATDRSGLVQQVACLESDEMESLFDEISARIGMPVDHFLVEAQKAVGKALFAVMLARYIKYLPDSRFFRPQWMFKLIFRVISKQLALIGFGWINLESYRAGRYLVLRVRDPVLIPRTVGSALGFFESLEKFPAARAEWHLEGNDLIIHLVRAEEEPPDESRLDYEEVEPGNGVLSYEKCSACGAPLESARLMEWDLDTGVIRNRITGNREVLIAVQSIYAIEREFEKELGEEFSGILFEAQKKIARERLSGLDRGDMEAFWDEYLRTLALRGLGYPIGFDREKESISVEIVNAYNQVLYAAKCAAALEYLTGGPSEIAWEKREAGHGVYRLAGVKP